MAVGTDNGALVFRPNPDGISWTLKAHGLYGRQVRALAFHPDGSLFAGAANGTVYRTCDLENWEPLFEGLTYPSVHSLAIHPSRPDVLLAGTQPAAVFRSQDRGRTWTQLKSFNQVPGTDRWTNPLPPYRPHVSSLAFHPGYHDVIVAAVEVGGALLSIDGGLKWTELNGGLARDPNALALHSGRPNTMYATTGLGFYRSDDRGYSWKNLIAGLPYIFTHGLAVDPENAERLMIGVNKSKRGGGATMFRSTDAGQSWQISSSGIATGADTWLTAVGSGGGYFVAGTASGDLYSTPDFGQLWRKIRTGLPPIRTICIGHD